MIGKDLGPYRLISELGSGGMGTVFLAEVTGDAPPGVSRGDRVAIKVVHPHLLSTPGFFKRFLREAELGKQVRHENVVRTFDVDATLLDDKQVNYMVMEYVEGRSLRQLLNDLKTVPEALLREIALQSASGLAAIHAEDIVHRDLKPENILITDDQRIRIMDLGVAKLQEASVAITKEGQFAGSFLYAAPEQFRNENVGPSADLYSMGITLYELATGKTPFHGDDAASVIHAQLETIPPRITERTPEASLFFAEVTATLLAKKAAERFDSAETLRTLLQEAEASTWWKGRERGLRRAQQSRLQIKVRRETDLVGRADPIAQLQEAWAKAKRGEGAAVLIEGEPGIGKTRLLDAFVRTLESDDAHLLYGAYPPSGGLGGLSEGIRGKFGASGLDESLKPYLTVTPMLVPAFAALVNHESPPTGSEPISADVQHTVFGHLVHALAEEKPTLWIVEDLHFASEDSRRLLLSLARAAEGRKVLVVSTSRPGIPEQELTHFGKLDHFKRFTLGRLSPREVVELAREAFHSASLADKLGAKIAYKSDGVPFFVFEMIRSLKEGGLVRERADGTFEQTKQITDIEVPSAVKDLVEARLRELTENQRAILDVGAVQGYEFDPDLVARVLEEKRVRVLRELAELERRLGLVRGEAGVSRFDQNQVQEVLYNDLPPDLRAEYHALLADTFVERDGIAGKDSAEVPGETAFFLASQYLRGNRPQAALAYLDRALDHLAESYRNDAALDLADRALLVEGVLTGERRLRILLRKADRLDLLGRRDDQSKVLEESLPLADELGDAGKRAAVHRALGNQATVMAQNAEALAHLEKAVSLAREAGDKREEAAAVGALGVLYFYTGQPGALREQFERQLALAREIGDLNAEATATGRIGTGLAFQGNVEDARAHFQESLDVARKIGNRERESVALLNLGEMATWVGQLDTAQELLSEGSAVSRSIGAQRVEGEALLYLGVVAERAGDRDRAEACFRAALELRRRIRDQNAVARCLIALGRLHLGAGAHAEALRELEEGIELATQAGAAEVAASGIAYVALLTHGETDTARKELDEHGSKLDFGQELEARFTLWKASGDEASLEKAHSMLMHLRDHAPEDQRETMIQNVPLYGEIVDAWNAR